MSDVEESRPAISDECVSLPSAIIVDELRTRFGQGSAQTKLQAKEVRAKQSGQDDGTVLSLVSKVRWVSRELYS